MDRTEQQAFQATFAAYKQAIDEDIAVYAAHATNAARSQYGLEAGETTEAFLDLVRSGGKRIRGALTMVGYEMLGGRDHQMIVRAATAMEMIHTYLLVLDDIEDRSLLRRGKPTVHARLTGSKLAQGDPHVGMGLAINAALAGNHAAQMLLAGLNVDHELIRKVLGIVNLTMVVTSHGQNLDLIMKQRGAELPTEDELEHLLQWKTAEYTFLNPLCVGMVLAGAGCEDTNAIREYALHAGKAFQLANDIQGVFGTKEANGKDIHEDLREGKRTYLTVYALLHAPTADRDFLTNMMSNQSVAEADFTRCQAIIKDSGALMYAEHIRGDHINRALEALHTVYRPWPAQYVALLRQFAQSLGKGRVG